MNEKYLERLKMLRAWLQDNVDMESEIIFDDGSEDIGSEAMLEALEFALDNLKSLD